MGPALLLVFVCLLVSDVDAAGDEKSAVRFTAPKFDGKQTSWAVWLAMFKSFLTLTCLAAFQLLDRPPVTATRAAIAASEGILGVPAITEEDVAAEDRANQTLWHLLIQSIDDADTVRALLPHAGNGHAAFLDLENRFVGAPSDRLLGLVLEITNLRVDSFPSAPMHSAEFNVLIGRIEALGAPLVPVLQSALYLSQIRQTDPNFVLQYRLAHADDATPAPLRSCQRDYESYAANARPTPAAGAHWAAAAGAPTGRQGASTSRARGSDTRASVPQDRDRGRDRDLCPWCRRGPHAESDCRQKSNGVQAFDGRLSPFPFVPVDKRVHPARTSDANPSPHEPRRQQPQNANNPPPHAHSPFHPHGQFAAAAHPAVALSGPISKLPSRSPVTPAPITYHNPVPASLPRPCALSPMLSRCHSRRLLRSLPHRRMTSPPFTPPLIPFPSFLRRPFTPTCSRRLRLSTRLSSPLTPALLYGTSTRAPSFSIALMVSLARVIALVVACLLHVLKSAHAPASFALPRAIHAVALAATLLSSETIPTAARSLSPVHPCFAASPFHSCFCLIPSAVTSISTILLPLPSLSSAVWTPGRSMSTPSSRGTPTHRTLRPTCASWVLLTSICALSRLHQSSSPSFRYRSF